MGSEAVENEEEELELHVKPFEMYAMRRRGYVPEKFLHEGLQGRVFRARALGAAPAPVAAARSRGRRAAGDAVAPAGAKATLSASASCQTVASPWERTFAVKIMSVNQSASWAEIEALERLKNVPGVLQLVEFFEAGDDLFLVTEFVEGGDLLDLTRSSALSLAETLLLARRVLKIIESLHREGVAHRDIKLENFMCSRLCDVSIETPEDRVPEVVVIDFGLAKHVSTAKAQIAGDWCGTVCYCSPELIQSQPYNPFESDMWAFGVLLYVLLVKKFPFGTDVDLRTRERIVHTPLSLDSARQAELWPQELKGLLLVLLDKNPSGRPNAARALRLLDAVLSPQQAEFEDDATFLRSIAESYNPEDSAAACAAGRPNRKALGGVNDTSMSRGMFAAMSMALGHK
eukprot:CAMPEP_0185829792 /NCGR_PEP_ID=MMETSP1353-20130828/449_1 /TAXON_ID=1077150 /ORGANISM="Erythrolobus australicus, Strain CCMP3124" /LENGTH=401 /DNA_ID=CAMNT_0028527619 /DNA_START=61 /DNA_END=1266 /DNA_ORIENTATION=+